MKIFYALLACCVIAVPSYAQKNGDKAGLQGDPVQISLGGDLVQARSHVKGPDDATGKPTLVFQRFALQGTVNLKTPGKAVDVTLTNPNSKVKFFLPGQALTDANAQSSLKLSLPGDGSAKHFQVASDSETGSATVGDTIVEADSTTGKKIGSTKLTVFWFKDPSANVNVVNPYRFYKDSLAQYQGASLDRNLYIPVPVGGGQAAAVSLQGEATLSPNIPDKGQLQGMSLGIIQSVRDKGSVSLTIGPALWSDTLAPEQRDFITWLPASVNGKVYPAPKAVTSSVNFSSGLDGLSAANPFYDKPGASPDSYPNSMKGMVMGSQTVVEADDYPSISNDANSSVDYTLKDPTGSIAIFHYKSLIHVTHVENFRTWAAVQSPQSIVLVAQADWELNLDSGKQDQATVHGSVAPPTDAYPSSYAVTGNPSSATPSAVSGTYYIKCQK